MIKVKDGYAKLIGENLYGDVNRVLLSNGGDKIIGNAKDNIPINNGAINANLNAELLGNKSEKDFRHIKIGEFSITPNLGHYGGSIVKSTQYYKISITGVTNIWTMLNLEISLTENHGTPTYGKLLIYVEKNNSNSLTYKHGTLVGNFSTQLKVYCYYDGDFNIYIAGNWSYPTIEVTKALFGDTSAQYSAKDITLTYIDSLPSAKVEVPISIGLTSTNYYTTLDERYYTETEANSRFVNVSGDTMTGQLTISSINHPSGIAYGGAIQLREKGNVTNTQTAWEYSPAISFHWGQRRIKRLGMDYQGNLKWDDSLIYHAGNLTKSTLGLENVQNTAFYKRSTNVNGATWDMAGTNNSNAFTIYAPTTTGTSGQVLISSGGTPSWTNQSDITAGASSYLITSSISTESSIINSGLRIYQGSGNSWTGAISSMSYAGILTLGDASRGWQLWAQRGNGNTGSLHFRVGTEDASAWNTERVLLDNVNSSVSGGGSTWGSSITVNIGGTSKTLTIPSNPNTDQNVKQGVSSNSKFRCLLLGTTQYDSVPRSLTEITGQAYITKNIYVNPSNATLYATTFSGALSGNATSATKLATARTLWGQSFNGTANVSGSMSGVGDITFSGQVFTIKNFGSLVYDCSNSTTGWARGFRASLTKDSTTTTIGSIGLLGSSQTFTYAYLSAGEHYSNNAIRVYLDGSVKLGSKTVGSSSKGMYLNAGVLTACSSVNADALSGYYINPVDQGTLFKHNKYFTDTTNAVWYIKVVFNTTYNNKSIKFTAHPSYNNKSGAVYFTIDSYAADRGITVKTSHYNGNNCTGYYYERISEYDTLWLQFNGDASASVTLYSTYDIKSWDIATPSGITFVSLTQNEILTNYTLEVPRLIKTDSSDSYVLLGGGGHKLISDVVKGGYIGTTQVQNSSVAQALTGITTADFSGDITLNQTDTDRFINLNYTNTGYDWRIGNLGSGNGDANYFVIQSDKTGTTYYDALKIGCTSLKTWLGGELNINGLAEATNFKSTITTGTQPYACTSTTLNTNLNADLLDGYHASSFALASQIPSVGNGTITITQGGDYKGSFTMNQSGNTTIELSDSNTTYSAGTGLSLTGTTFNINAGNEFPEGSSNLTDGTQILTSYASDNGFDDADSVGIVYKRKASCIYGYIKGKLDGVYQAKGSYLTSHQTIYNLTLQAGAFSATTFDPNGSAATVNIPTHTSHLINDNGFITNANLSNYLQKSGGTMASDAIISNANGDLYIGDTNNSYYVTFSDIQGWPTDSSGNINTNGSSNWYISVDGSASFKSISLDGSSSQVLLANGDAKSFTTSVTSGSTALVTSGAVYSKLASYLPLAGGAMTSGARISASGGSLYVGNSDNAGWLYLQDCASQSSISNWTIRANGNAMFTNVNLTKNLTLTNTSGSYNGIIFNFDSTVGTYVYQTYDSSTSYYSLTVDGNVFIGGSGKGNLNVNGILQAQGGKFYTNSSGVYWSSDRRLKDNINSARNLNIDSLIKEFDWKDTGKHSWGFIAQELLEVLPEAVNYNKDTDRYSVNYDVAHSAAIASLNVKIKQLELRIKELEDGKASNE